MSLVPYQNLKVVGALEVFTPQNASTDRGQIKFTGEFGADYGKLKAVGFGGFGNLMLDCANLQNGLVIRTAANQDSGISGQQGPFAPYSFKVLQSNGLAGQGCVTPSMLVDYSDSNFGNTTGSVILQARRGNTSQVFPTTKMQTCIVAYTQNTWRSGESITMNIGFQSTFGCGVIGYYTPSGSGSDPNNRLFLGVYNSSLSLANRALAVTPADNVEIPNQLTAGTVSATTYINLPPPTPTMLLPLTLIPSPGYVGINTTNPTYALDVTGDGYISGQMTATTVSATTYLNLPPPTPSMLLPITLDPTNNRVGINNLSPQQALDVVGNVRVSGADIICGTGNPNGVVSAIVGSLFMRTDGTYSSALYLKSFGTGNTGWITLNQNGFARPQVLSNNWLTPCLNSSALTSSNPSANFLRMIPFYVDYSYTIKNISWTVNQGATGSLFDFCIYGSDSTGLPTGSAIWSVANQSANVTGTVIQAASFTLPTYEFLWLGFRRNTTNASWASYNQSALIPLTGLVPTGGPPGVACILRFPSNQGDPFPTITSTILSGATYVSDGQPALFLQVA